MRLVDCSGLLLVIPKPRIFYRRFTRHSNLFSFLLRTCYTLLPPQRPTSYVRLKARQEDPELYNPESLLAKALPACSADRQLASQIRASRGYQLTYKTQTMTTV